MRLFGLDGDIAQPVFCDSVQLAVTEGSGHGVVYASQRSLDRTAQGNAALGVDRTAAEVIAVSHYKNHSSCHTRTNLKPLIPFCSIRFLKTSVTYG